MKSSVVIVDSFGKPPFATLLDGQRPLEAALAGDDHPLGEVAQHRVRGVAERSPRARPAGAGALLPHDLAAQQEMQPVLQDVDHVGGQAAVRLAAEVGDVDRDPAAGLEHAHAFGEHVVQQLEVLEVRARHAVALELLLVLLAGEVRRRRDDQRHAAVGERRACRGRRRRRTVRRPDRAPAHGCRCRAPGPRSAGRSRTRRATRAGRRRSSRSSSGPSSNGVARRHRCARPTCGQATRTDRGPACDH